MATSVLKTSLQLLQKNLLRPTISANGKGFLTRTVVSKVTKESGAVLPRPEQTRFGLIKSMCVVVPFLMTGALISREFATWLEEHELFVPDDDDDD